MLQASLFNISEQQFFQTLKMLTDDGYVKGLVFTPTIGGEVVSGINRCYVTSSGLQYLKDNSEMKRLYKILKEARDWLPLLK
ncbi:MAG: YjcQ family protein [Lactobacillus sp.]|nr:YjcQ family protein [Lactobacillus sp.]